MTTMISIYQESSLQRQATFLVKHLIPADSSPPGSCAPTAASYVLITSQLPLPSLLKSGEFVCERSPGSKLNATDQRE